MAMMAVLALNAQGVKPLPSLHVDGRWLVDTHGNHVVLHGVMDTPNMYFNGNRWTGGYNDTGKDACLVYFEKLFTGMEKAKCNIFRLHLDPAWSNENAPWDVSENNISYFNKSRLEKYLTSLFIPLMKMAMNHGMYVVVRPPGVCPDGLKVGDYYQDYLLTVWDIVSKNADIKSYSGQISLELANEPISIRNADNQDDTKALHDYFQPIVDKIRSNGFTGIIWIPGTGWQANYTSYATYPIEGYNIGYAVHDYPGWYGGSDDHAVPTEYIKQFHEQVPVIDTNPIFISEVDWSPEDPNGEGHYDEHHNWVKPNLGTWGTGSTSKWGRCFRALLDYYGNISMTLTHPHDFFDIDRLLKDGTVVAAFNENPEACGKTCMDWYADFYYKDWPRADFKNISLSDQGNGKYKNPVIFADFPDPDVIRVGDTYYMVTTTMHHFPGATIVKSKDLVNWEYCAKPLEQLSSSDRYSLLNGENAYAAGMWACSMKYHDGKFYILINGNDAGGWLLTATDPEGKWEKKKLSRIYYDPGMLFDNGKVYVACGIGNIQMCELDEDFNYIQEKNVISNKDGLEGCHLYKIGDYYYIYATYGGWPSGQAVFRSKDIFGPYEEKMLVEKVIDGKANTVHQGALFDTPGGQWWTILQEDLGALGRMPNLQPVRWVSDWPVVGNNGKPWSLYVKPKTGEALPRVPLPTNDNFRSYPIGQQWEWNHNPDDGAWTLFERPGWLRLKTSGTAQRLTQARNMLTQRIFGFIGKTSLGTVRLDASGMQEGDRAGICIFQDPYALIAVQVKDGKKQLVWRQDTLRTNSSFTPSEQVKEVAIDSVVYLRATISYATSKTQFYYSLDNKTYTALGGETELGFNLTVFVGARFGLFCYATQPESQGYADFDWFSTENDYDEAMFYPATFEGYSEDMLTLEKMELPSETVEVMAGNNTVLLLEATFRDGHKEDVAAKARYEVDNEEVVQIRNGRLYGIAEGTAHVTVYYTDPMGHEQQDSFSVRSTFFPFGSQYISTSLFGNGTYNEKTRTFHPSQWGQMGWVYPSGADMSGYKYLVVKLAKQQNCQTHLNIFQENNIWTSGYESPEFGSNKRIVVNLQTAKIKNGSALNTKHISIVAFWSNGSGDIVVDDVYLTNNSDYSPASVEGITTVKSDRTNVYSLSGQLLRRNVLSRQAADGLPAGIYVVEGKKIIKK
jgi:beta-xylosidase